jgi:hypothetical protein
VSEVRAEHGFKLRPEGQYVICEGQEAEPVAAFAAEVEVTDKSVTKVLCAVDGGSGELIAVRGEVIGIGPDHAGDDRLGLVRVFQQAGWRVAAKDQTPAYMEAYQSASAAVASKHGVRIPAWFTVEGTIVGDGREWHQVRFNQFPSKAAFMAVVADPTRLKAQHDHREAAIADTYTMIVRPRINQLGESL